MRGLSHDGKHKIEEAAGWRINSARENVAQAGGDVDQAAAAAVDMWMKSSGHKTNMLASDVASAACGWAACDRQIYWTCTYGPM